MKYIKRLLCFCFLFILSGCTISIFNFITNNSEQDLWMEYTPNSYYENLFGNENSNRFEIETDLAFTNKNLRNAVKDNPLNRNPFIKGSTIRIKLPKNKTTHISNLPQWSDIDSLIDELQIKIVDNKNEEVIQISSLQFKIKHRVCNITIE